MSSKLITYYLRVVLYARKFLGKNSRNVVKRLFYRRLLVKDRKTVENAHSGLTQRRFVIATETKCREAITGFLRLRRCRS